jgi:hypothetical protein
MSDEEHNSRIEKISSLIEQDHTSLDEQNPKKLQKYVDFAKKNYNLSQYDSIQLVNEAFLYLKLKNAKDYDPLQQADKFGAGFS